MASVWIQQSGVQKWLDASVVQAGERAHRSRKVNRLHQWMSLKEANLVTIGSARLPVAPRLLGCTMAGDITQRGAKLQSRS
jgi:hypothetical protein